MRTFKISLIKLHWLLSSQFGLDPQHFLRSLRGLPLYLRDLLTFRKGYTGKLKLMPCLHDRYAEGGTTKSEYFWQDLLVARAIHEAKPVKHVDVGSRVDGFVAHVASFREIEVFDVRSITTSIPGVTFTQADLMDVDSVASLSAGGGYCDSLSCLHALEHFGLGRYGDPLDPQGYSRGLVNLAALLKPHGLLYLAVPMGRERVEFNANWVFAPRTILNLAIDNGLRLEQLHVFRAEAGLVECPPSEWKHTLDTLATQPYHLVVMRFAKTGVHAS